MDVVYEIVGYVASVLVLISLMMSSVLKLRALSLAGAVAFAAYGFLIGAYPIAIVNLAIIGVNLFYLRRMLTAREYFSILEVRMGNRYIDEFLRFHADDITAIFPDLDYEPQESNLRFFILRDMVPAGLFIGTPLGDGTMRVVLDYVIPGYRDLKVGRWLYRRRAGFFLERGIRRLVSHEQCAAHRRYLERMGFAPAAAPGTHELELVLPPA